MTGPRCDERELDSFEVLLQTVVEDAPRLHQGTAAAWGEDTPLGVMIRRFCDEAVTDAPGGRRGDVADRQVVLTRCEAYHDAAEGLLAEGRLEEEAEIAGAALIEDLHTLNAGERNDANVIGPVTQDGYQRGGKRLAHRGVIEPHECARDGFSLVEKHGDAAAAEAHEKILQTARVTQLDRTALKAFVTTLGYGVVDAQDSRRGCALAAPVDGG